MSYSFSIDETTDTAFKRIFDELTDGSVEHLRHVTSRSAAGAIHETRKNCKKGRGLARLVRPVLGDAYSTVNRGLRDAARLLAPIRDDHALLGIFDDLVASTKELLPDSGVSGVRAVLARRAERATSTIVGAESHRLDEASETIESVRGAVAATDIPDGFDAMKDGMKRTYRRGRDGLATSDNAPNDDNFHEWRKRVKYFWYQMRLVRDTAPPILGPLTGALHDLSDALGDAHDLSILITQTEGMRTDVDHDQIDAVQLLARGRKTELEERATILGHHLYVETPSAFVKRIEGYWTTCRTASRREAGGLSDLFPPDDHLSELSGDELRELANIQDPDEASSLDRAQLERRLRATGV